MNISPRLEKIIKQIDGSTEIKVTQLPIKESHSVSMMHAFLKLII